MVNCLQGGGGKEVQAVGEGDGSLGCCFMRQGWWPSSMRERQRRVSLVACLSWLTAEVGLAVEIMEGAD
jgi:hypothetical protein